MFHRVLTSVTLAFSLGAFLALTPTPAHAIPVQGDYLFTSGLTGTFSSDGSKVTIWDFIDPFNVHWTAADGPSQVFLNNASFLSLSNKTNFVVLDWSSFIARVVGPNGNSATIFTIDSAQTPIPEPSSGLLLLAGLGLLAAYGLRQRRQAGLQIG